MTDTVDHVERVRDALEGHHAYHFRAKGPQPHDDVSCEVDAALASLDALESERNELREALVAIADWSLPRWEPDNPQTEGEQIRLFAIRVLGAELCPCACHPFWPDMACTKCIKHPAHRPARRALSPKGSDE